MTASDEKPSSWMVYEISLNEELKLEHAIREVSAHPDIDRVRKLCAQLMRQNYYQQQLLANAVGRISQLELVVFLGAQAEPCEAEAFFAMAREICEDLGIG